MSISHKLAKYLEQEKVGFEALKHPLTYTASETAGSQHVPGRQMIKSVIINADGKLHMCVVTAEHFIDFDKLKTVLSAKEVQLAKEQEFVKLFPDYALGAEPPFGHLYGLRVIMDKIIEKNHDIAFNAGTHTDIVKMKLKDYLRLENPTIADISTHI